MKHFIIIVLSLTASYSTAVETTAFTTKPDGNFSAELIPSQSGIHQLWLTYRSTAPEAFPLSATDGATSLTQTGQPTPAEAQHFRQFLGTLPATIDSPSTITLNGQAANFTPTRLELIPAPSLSLELEPLLHASLGFYDQLVRTPNGLYRDTYNIGSPPRDQQDRHHYHLPRPNSTCSVSAVGVGLMALCISHELGLDDDAAAKALQTLRLINGKDPDIQLDRDPTGFLRHFVSIYNGSGRSEFSTIDTAILAVGALYCRNTFDSPEVREEADAFWHSVDWSTALAQADGERLYMVLQDGQPDPNSITKLFSEYYLLAWLIRESEIQQTGSSEVDLSLTLRWPYRDMTLLTDGRPSAHSSFQVQFPLYMCHPATTDPLYFSFAGAQARADHLTGSESSGNQTHWGAGAGGTPARGYVASDFNNNPGNIASPRIIGGFLPVYPKAQAHLIQLYNNPDRRLQTPVGDLLPRFTPDDPEWQHHRIESIDFSSMMFGLAAIHPDLGMTFFQEKTRFTFPPPEGR